MRRMSLRAGVLGLLVACGQTPTIVQPPTFERPGDVAFTCFDTVERSLVPLITCTGVTGTEDDRYSLTALVTQTASGEVAAVDLRTNQVLDADRRVPGFTFVRVGEFPTDLVVPPNDPGVSYVAAFGSRRVEYYATARFRPDVDAPAIPIEQEGAVSLGFGPVDLALSADGASLFAALPRAGAIARLTVEADGTLAESFEMVDLDPTIVPAAPPASGTTYQRVCMDGAVADARVRTPNETRDLEIAFGDAPEPHRLLVDGDMLLVADGSRPLIHRFRIAEPLEPLPPIMTGVPVLDLVATPEVPSTTNPAETGTARFLYAIDATDHSVLVVDYLEGSPSFGAVLPVQIGDGDPDRLRLLSDARTLEVMTPGFPGDVCTIDAAGATSVDPSTVTPGHLRGVFLAVGTSDGLIQLIDVHDLNATCRGGLNCTNPADERDGQVFVRRHVARRATFITESLGVIGTPSFSLAGAPGRLEPDGSTGGDHGLQVIDCPAFMGPIFPAGSTEPVVCGILEPWSARAERWSGTYEGAIPAARTGRARVEGDRIIFPGANLCARGVLGREDVAASMLTEQDPEFGYLGDQVVVTSDPPSSRAEACAVYVLDEELGTREQTLRIPVLAAGPEELRVPPDHPALGELARCYPSLFAAEIQTLGAFTVVGATSGFEHRVVTNEEGACRIDVVGQPYDASDPATHRNGRAFLGRPYSNPHVAFTMRDLEEPFAVGAGLESELSFSLGNVPPVLVADPGLRARGRRPVILERVVFSAVDQNLYAVDSNSDGFVQFALDPLQVERTFE